MKSRVRKSVTERIAHLDARAQIVTVAHENALAVFAQIALSGKIVRRGTIFVFEGEAFGELARGVHLAREHVHARAAAVLPGKPDKEHCVHLVRPGQFHRAAAREHDDDVLVHRRKARDQLVLLLGQAHMAPVKALRLKTRGQTRHNNDFFVFRRLRLRLRKQLRALFLAHALFERIARLIGIGHALLRERVQKRSYLMRVDERRACALEARLCRHFPDHEHLFAL